MYDITLDDFTGPMDLLLSLIKQHKMDIMHIKLEIIIDEYLKFISELQERNLDIASSYLVMASELLEIKSRMLLPKQEDEDEEEDPQERVDKYTEFRSKMQETYKKEMSSLQFYIKDIPF